MAQRLRRAMAIFAIHASWLVLRERGGTAMRGKEGALVNA
ncbi:hypothetical protein BDK92_0539 [Micromonospora pisi]|uniref:Uncharacterized protein n=1 Tax=Micromonospora pisi TaxID=589240 RepID=A0A495JBM8_9ACTN|nr:hypothetical protein BDK92_0539 [Micromonospora pisi]